MKYGQWSLGTLLMMAMFAVVVSVFSSGTQLGAATDSELETVFGAGCSGYKVSTNYCSGAAGCVAQGTGSQHARGTNNAKRWCAGDGTGKTCDCNQSGIAQSTCRETTHCTQPNCAGGCGTYSPSSTVQSTVNQNGAPCSDDGDCED